MVCHEGGAIPAAGCCHGPMLVSRRISLLQYLLLYLVTHNSPKSKRGHSHQAGPDAKQQQGGHVPRERVRFSTETHRATRALGPHEGPAGHLLLRPTNSLSDVSPGDEVIECFHFIHSAASPPAQHHPDEHPCTYT